MGELRENKEINIDWEKFKSNAKADNLIRAKQGYIEFCEMLHETDFELVSDYIKAIEKVELKYKLDDNIRFNTNPNNFKRCTYKAILDFKERLIKNNDEFIKFAGLSDGVLIAQIKTFDGGVVDIDMSAYNEWNKVRQDFYNKLREVGGYTSDYYKTIKDKIHIFIDSAALNSISPDNFKRFAYKSVINFKNNLKLNNDTFINFIGITKKGNLIGEVKTFDGGVIEIDTGAYGEFIKARQDFYNKLEEVNGYTTDFYKGKDVRMEIFIDSVRTNVSPSHFKTYTYNRIIKFKNNLAKDGDSFITFIGQTDKNSLIAKIKTFDGGEIYIDINSYSRWNKGRKNTCDYCLSKGYKVLSPYINATEKILANFNCGHKPNWILPSNLKQGFACSICSESKGEKIIRLYLEKNNINFKQEHRFKDCKHKNLLRFDFYIPNYNLCIEFDGEQHYKAFNHFGGEERFKDTKNKDKIKNNYCKENEINLLRIPYYEIENAEKILDREFEKLRKLKEVC